VLSSVVMKQALVNVDTAARALRLGVLRWCARRAAVLGVAGVVLAGSAMSPAQALQIEITGGGADRLERQRAWAQGDLPLAGTPDLGKLQERLNGAGLKEGAAVFVRIFKAESELELWMLKGREYKLFATYPICQWSGVLGPKFYEGDNQSPEGFYTVGRRDLKWQTRHHRSFNIGFPNAFDKLHGRTGSNILVHGGCSTEGCFAMTNPVIDEVFRLTNSAIASGQKEFNVHVFPFRMTAENLMAHSASPWLDFWINLKTGYDLFAETRLPPTVAVCKSRYVYDRVPEFGAAEPERDCDMPANVGPAGADSGNIVTTGSLRATAASPVQSLKPVVERSLRSASRRAVRGRSRDDAPAAGNAPEAPPTPTPLAASNPLGT
jgi:murein L,D-transpeptidase YafK